MIAQFEDQLDDLFPNWDVHRKSDFRSSSLSYFKSNCVCIDLTINCNKL